MKTRNLFITVALFQSAFAFGDDTADQIRDLRTQIEALNQKVKLLEQRNGLDQEKPEATRKDAAFLTAGADGFFMHSADKNFSLRILGYGQFDGRFYFNDEPAHDTFVMRRMRLGFEGTVFEKYEYKVLTDFGSGITSTAQNNSFLQDAVININYRPEFQVQFGKFKEPVSLEVLQSDSRLLFVERGLPTLLAPNRDVGIQLHGDLFESQLSYALGVFNGVSDGGSGDVETVNSGKQLAGRIFTQPFKKSEIEALQGLAFGVGGSYGDRAENLPNYVTPGRQRFFSYSSGAGTNAATANITASGPQWRVAPQGYYYFGPVGFYGEYVLSSQEVQRAAGGAPRSLTVANDAWNVAVSYVLTGEKNTFNRINPRHPLTLGGGGWGAWEIAARFGELSIDQSAYPFIASPASAQKITAWEIGLNWYLNKNVKFNFDYSQSHFSGGNDAPGSVAAQDEKVFLGRTQFSF